MQSRNLAARAGRWSAQHRKTAILGWILFVVLATVVGGKVGQNDLDESAAGSGESKRGDMIVKAAGFPEQAGEQVLVQGKGRSAGDPAGHRRREGRRERAWSGSRASPRSRARSTRRPRQHRLQGRPLGRRELHAARHRRARREARRRSRSPPWPPSRRAHPGVRVEQFGDASADQGDRRPGRQGRQEGRSCISYGLMLIILLVAFGALVAAGLPLVLGATAVAAHGRPARAGQPALRAAGRRGRARGDHRPRRRRRLRDVLLAPRDGGARPRPLGRGRGRDRRRHLGPRGAHLGPDRDDRDGRAAVRRQPDLRRLRHRHDARRRRRACSAR